MAVPVLLEQVLAPLKDFQRRTVDYAFRRMYLDSPAAPRFLVADEVGLGKTMVARGIIARVVEHLASRRRQIRVVYVCSNAAIAQQNVRRLNVFGSVQVALATRLTMLPVQLRQMRRSGVTFVSFTPGTTFDLKSRGGTADERAVLLRMLASVLPARQDALANLLQGGARSHGWWQARDRQSREAIPSELVEEFARRVRAESGMLARLEDACERFRVEKPRWPRSDVALRQSLTGDLRRLLAHVCVAALEPDLVILDEFQRYRELLDGSSPAASLARALLGYRAPDGREARTLLLSATPYRMSASDSGADNHYDDFIRTMSFLMGDEGGVATLKAELQSFRTALYGVGYEGPEELARARDQVQRRLLSVMVRTERVGGGTEDMLRDCPIPAPLQPGDLRQAEFTDRVAREVEAGDVVEYWKSAPYLLNLMKSYDLARRLRQARKRPSRMLGTLLRRGRTHLLRREQFGAYRRVDPANPRLRALLRNTVEANQWRHLWIPPSLPYLRPAGAYAGDGPATKALVFSAWHVVPDAIAALCSYEAERRMMAHTADEGERANRKRSAPMRFGVALDRRPTALSALCLLYPCATLARAVDPLRMAVEAGGPVRGTAARREAHRAIEPLLRATGVWPGRVRKGIPDPSWYWAALGLLDAHHAPGVAPWSRNRWVGVGLGHDAGGSSHFGPHVEHFNRVVSKPLSLGRPPEDLLNVLADIALGSPAVCALRALARHAPEAPLDLPPLLDEAARVAGGFRSLFSLPESAALLRGEGGDKTYWRLVLRYSVQGNLQAVLDEYAHILRESLDLAAAPEEERVRGIAREVASAVLPRVSTVRVEEVGSAPGKRGRRRERGFTVRCRFAMRLGDARSDEEAALRRVGSVAGAFNSPFRPFILATTSIGQEGLDFHPYCHIVYHWNLPSSPVDLEQREGRVHRYKGHAVRRNVAARIGLPALQPGWSPRHDPWRHLFDHAAGERPSGAGDLFPFWTYTGGPARVERRVPMLPLSREWAQLARLKERLALYRLVFGQPRQEDLLAHLQRHAAGRVDAAELRTWQISLAPPAAAAAPPSSTIAAQLSL
jgi:hypothetical protein